MEWNRNRNGDDSTQPEIQKEQKKGKSTIPSSDTLDVLPAGTPMDH